MTNIVDIRQNASHTTRSNALTQLIDGQMVLIGPTSNKDGTPLAIELIPQTTPMFVGWVTAGQADYLLNDLQRGNHKTLAIYGTVRATFYDVQKFYRELSRDHLKGHWYSVWSPMLRVLQIVNRPQQREQMMR